MSRGTLRVYLGAAPGVGKTFAMLNEARRRAERGTDVVVGYVETHGREHTAAQLGSLEVVPRRRSEYRGAHLEEMDTDAIIARRPDVVLVDELAHSNAPGSRHPKRWQDVDRILDAGIDVITTINIQHLESMNDVVEEITGIAQRETIPDEIVRRADQIEIVDMAPEALRRRMAHGNIYAAEKVDAALGNYFRVGNLSALRELALLWVADRVDEGLQRYREEHGIDDPWETRERVVVALTGVPGGADLVRRAARMAARSKGELFGVHVRAADGLRGSGSGDELAAQRDLLIGFGGTYHELASDDVAEALVRFARAENATQVVIGASRRSRAAELLRGSVVQGVVRKSGPIDVHVISSTVEDVHPVRMLPRRSTMTVPARQRIAAWTLAIVGPLMLGLVLRPWRNDIDLSIVLLLFLLFPVLAAVLGRIIPGVVAALMSAFVANFIFTVPYDSLAVSQSEIVVALVEFLAVAAIVSGLVSLAARRAAEAARARAEAETLAALGGAIVSAPDSIDALLEQMRRVFDAASAAVLRRTGDGWTVEAAAGEPPPPASPEAAAASVPLGATTVFVLGGVALSSDDLSVLRSFSGPLALAVEDGRLRADVATAMQLSDANELRTALLTAVSHDLRTPLASIKAAVTSLLQRDIDWTPEARAELLATIDEETDRLNGLVGNLLDMSRIRTGALDLVEVEIGYDEVVPTALQSVSHHGHPIEVDVEETLPRITVDPGLLERVVANLVENACTHSPEGAPVRVEAAKVGATVHLRVVDTGPGIPMGERELVFQPFQRLGDQPRGDGVGLGLAVARGFTEIMGGTLSVEDTPGGGTTMVLTFPAVATAVRS